MLVRMSARKAKADLKAARDAIAAVAGTLLEEFGPTYWGQRTGRKATELGCTRRVVGGN
ncbi:hypothetical protein GCM10007886_30240 [Methylobacterium gregans]|nr:hypothetical protein GCM10007886_30240 [Methylobacterium gregans]